MKKNKWHTDYEVVIIGAGFAGIGAGIRLKMTGNDDFRIFEKAAEVGGTWRDNTYPGCGCDVPSFLYSFSFEPNPNWTRAFSRQQEIWSYMRHCVRKYDLEPHIQYNTGIEALHFDENRGIWRVKDSHGNETTAKVVISAAGPFNAAFIPEIKGRDSFRGEAFHSLHWNHDYDLRNKKVAVIGTGASAIQFVPEIAPLTDQLYIFQRTPPWIAPKPDQEFPEKTRRFFKKYPWYQRFWREVIYWTLELLGLSLYSNNLIRAYRTKVALKHLRDSIPDPELRKKLTPDYALGCKRVLISDDYYPTLLRPNVELVTESIAEITPTGIRTNDGKLRQVDAIIYGTGFYVTEFPKLFEVYGTEKRNLFEIWNQSGPEAYYGMAVSGYPGLLFMVGPNTGLGHNSIIHMMESQLNYILDYIKMVRETPEPTAFYDLKKAVQEQFNARIQKKLSKMVWSSGGCKSYYLKNRDGKNVSIWPGSTLAYRKQTKRIKRSDYEKKIPGKYHSTIKTKEYGKIQL
ncbi:MAG: NAD(P)/FAD-dependent oxidoreductase [Bacteroidetes bacterium]|nr:MAG: NAD(P)/FAD-dependent oxidoreductase [Bacteroidota bacterium]